MKQKRTDESTQKQRNEHVRATPKFVRIPLNSISVGQKTASSLLQSRLRHLPQNSPTLTKEALAILELVAPMILTEVKSDDAQKYELLAGARTFQLLLEQLPRTAKCLAVLVTAPSATQKTSFGAFDSVVSKLIQTGSDLDLCVIAADLKQDGDFRNEVSRLMPLDTDLKLMAALGMTKSTFYRVIDEVKKNRITVSSTPEVTGKLDLGLSDFQGDESP